MWNWENGKIEKVCFCSLISNEFGYLPNNNQLSINSEPGINPIQQITEAESKSDDNQSQKN